MTNISPETDETTAAYYAALQFVCVVDALLAQGTIHLRDCEGRLLATLDEVLAAIEAGRWPAEAEQSARRAWEGGS